MKNSGHISVTIFFQNINLPYYPSNHMFGGLVEGDYDIHKEFPSFSHPPEAQSKNYRPDNQAQSIESINMFTHQTHFCVFLKQDETLSENNCLMATSCIKNYDCE